ncbi:MAG: hypothetical protein Q9220_007449 [cf. Caloplaca sp. 1 TL-2023]
MTHTMGMEHSPSPKPSKSTPFRLKRRHPGDSSATSATHPEETRIHHRHRHHHHRHRHANGHHHRNAHRRRSPSPISHDTFDPDTAFRESLFDALADDEGAAYWESVYGQPIHTYRPYSSSANNNPEQVELQRMTDDDYASYVRARMWEKSHGYIIEERRRREEETLRQNRRKEQDRRWEREIEEALRKGRERRDNKKWKDIWARYLRGWEAWALSAEQHDRGWKERIPWPVESGQYKDTGREQVEMFFKQALRQTELDKDTDCGNLLKSERIRWHPDRFLQRAGGQELDSGVLTAVTAIFQIIDGLWSEIRLER